MPRDVFMGWGLMLWGLMLVRLALVSLMLSVGCCTQAPPATTPSTYFDAEEIDRIFRELIRAALADEKHGVWRGPAFEMPPEMMPDLLAPEMFLDLQGEAIQHHEMRRLMQGLEALPYDGPSYGGPSHDGPSHGGPSYGGPSYGGPSHVGM